MSYAGQQTGLVPVGVVLPFAGTNAPYGFLLCDGSQVSRTSYANLFAALGVTHGSGDGSTTFNLPDYRGRFMRGVDGGTARDADAAARTAMASGGNTGAAVGSVQADGIKQHFHRVLGALGTTAAGMADSTATGFMGTSTTPTTVQNLPNSNAATPPPNPPIPSHVGQTSDTRPLNVAVNFIVKF